MAIRKYPQRLATSRYNFSLTFAFPFHRVRSRVSLNIAGMACPRRPLAANYSSKLPTKQARRRRRRSRRGRREQAPLYADTHPLTLHVRPTIAIPVSFAHVANKLINSVFINPPPPSSLPPAAANKHLERRNSTFRQTDRRVSVPIIFPPCQIICIYIYTYLYTRLYKFSFATFSTSIPFHQSISS